jgi:hypothetical protein
MGGEPITVTGEPDQLVNMPREGLLIINQRSTSHTPSGSTIQLVPLEVLADYFSVQTIFAFSYAHVYCPGPVSIQEAPWASIKRLYR